MEVCPSGITLVSLKALLRCSDHPVGDLIGVVSAWWRQPPPLFPLQESGDYGTVQKSSRELMGVGPSGITLSVDQPCNTLLQALIPKPLMSTGT